MCTDIGWKHLAILNSIYECQDENLVKMYTPKVLENSLLRVQHVQTRWNALLYLGILPLYPSDRLSLALIATMPELS